MLGCGAVDSIEHYTQCGRYHSLCSRFLGLVRPPVERALDAFIGIAVDGAESRGNPSLSPVECCVLRALGLYALHRTHGQLRHGLAQSEAANVFRGFLRESTRNHPRSQRILSQAFSATPARQLA